MKAVFVSDLHGSFNKYKKLFELIRKEKPNLVFFGGDLEGHIKSSSNSNLNFYDDYFLPAFTELKNELRDEYPQAFIILGNDDPKSDEKYLLKGESDGLWNYIPSRKINVGEFSIYGYAYNPPSPFQLKDWEKYDVSRYLDPGCISPEEGFRTAQVPGNHIRYATIAKDLQEQFNGEDLSRSIILFHTPPYNTKLDRADLDHRIIDHAPVDVHVGSVAVRNFIEKKQPYLTLHGHVHESTKLTGAWQDEIGRTKCFNAAHKGSELSVITFNLNDLFTASRILI